MHVWLPSSFRYGRSLVIGLLIFYSSLYQRPLCQEMHHFSDLMMTLELTDKPAASSAGLPPAPMHRINQNLGFPFYRCLRYYAWRMKYHALTPCDAMQCASCWEHLNLAASPGAGTTWHRYTHALYESPSADGSTSVTEHCYVLLLLVLMRIAVCPAVC